MLLLKQEICNVDKRTLHAREEEEEEEEEEKKKKMMMLFT
jgi:hypothetical protein